MKATALLTTITLACLSPFALGASELENLRAICAEQERQIQHLEKENESLNDLVAKLKANKSAAVKPIGEQAAKSVPANASQMVSQEKKAPTEAKPEAAKPAPAVKAAPAKGETYTVVSGDSLYKIANSKGVSVAAIMEASQLSSTKLDIGQELTIPPASGVQSDPTTSQISVPVLKTPGKSPSPKPSADSAHTAGTYVVKPGDTFYSIGKAHGVSTKALMAANPTVKPSNMRVGQKLKLVSAGSSSSSQPATSKAPAPTSIAPASEPEAQVAKVSQQAKVRPINIDRPMTFEEFARKHGVSTDQLNALNKLTLSKNQVLAEGSELYVPVK
ncbi:muramidase family protein [Persicirhabdus sediminis]|uniref:LysM peptidoglycan-binding domain-containing protein n=1 Tax=Persicirhabdus sediminis TaxID=454144 RepID=A0A8J7MGW7_9BACT|nr:LysM peptidoglycan-binding domain-containing protein [Persicirhabdus sediminis]MBK1792725.1 LysM peptidoglycan-binding domain-containing protein [Persicirhabdus sediminis]